jgi:hypothetical protein
MPLPLKSAIKGDFYRFLISGAENTALTYICSCS